MDPLDPKLLAVALVEEMKAHGHALWIDPETHAEQHEFIAQMILERKERMARRKRVEEMVAGSLVLSTILVCISLLGAGILVWVRKGA